METLLYRGALSRFGQALSDATRTEILMALRDGSAYPTELAQRIGVSPQILSNHLACLRGCGMVISAREGRRNRYELADDRIGEILGAMLAMPLVVDPANCPDSETKDCC